jgi:hypothetical protein
LEARGLATAGVLVSPPSLQPKALIPICEDFLHGAISAHQLEEIGKLLLERSDHYYQNEDYSGLSEYPNNVELILVEWAYGDLGHSDSEVAWHTRRFLAQTTSIATREKTA